MAVNPVLVVKVVDNTSVGVRARLYDDFSEHNILLNSVLTYWWANNMPPAVKFLELFDSVIKRTINEIMPHKTLNLKYGVKADNILENASQIEINLISISADGIGFKIDGDSVFLKDLRKVEDDFEPKEFSTTFDQCIETPDIVLKKYREMKGD
ncbi:hypothetical protein [Methanobrevibacter sp.]|uniref:hypothetical protein n=1 Tax=Methanobrevibacter sp. TaxID=66852 RepID=UPI003D7DEE79